MEESQNDLSILYIETPVEGGFKDSTCILPDYEWEVHGYSDEEMKYFKDFVENDAQNFGI